ncbi:MAG: preprotein translocase subunit YajC [Actinobacteria bacterium]|nr:preprotein translocase subunit YajC [Actinomycetota bacterium]
MFLIMWLMLIRPQRQQQRRHAAMIEALKPGDEIITNGGIYGDVVGVEDDRVLVEIAEDVEIEVVKRAIATIVPPEDADAIRGDDDLRATEPEATADAEPEPTTEDAARR